MSKVLFICRSNVARSQMGEAMYNHYTGTDEAFSAGTAVGDFRNVPSDVVWVMRKARIDIGDAHPKQLTPEMVETAGRVILMTTFQVPDYLKEDESKVDIWDVPDPRGRGIEGLLRAREQIRYLIHEQLLTGPVEDKAN